MADKNKPLERTEPKALVIHGVMCRLGFHKWQNLRKDIPNPKAGEMICWSALHKCDRCGKEEMKGMGCIC